MWDAEYAARRYRQRQSGPTPPPDRPERHRRDSRAFQACATRLSIGAYRSPVAGTLVLLMCVGIHDASDAAVGQPTQSQGCSQRPGQTRRTRAHLLLVVAEIARRLLHQDKHGNRQQTQRREQNVMAPTGNQSNHFQSPMTFQMAQSSALLQLRCTIMGAALYITTPPLLGSFP